MSGEEKATIPKMTAEDEAEVTKRLAVGLAYLGVAVDGCLEASGMPAHERQYAVEGFLSTCVAVAGVAVAKLAAFAEITVEPGADAQIRRAVEASLETALDHIAGVPDDFMVPVDDAPDSVDPSPPNT